MADFDPYYQWLAIPPKDQPPNHYRLLAVELFESNTDVIANAADQRMAHVRSFQAGKHSGLSQELLNEIAAAKICLLNPAKKDAYDETLRKSQKPPLSHPLPPPPPPAPPAPPPAPEHSQLQFRSAPQPSDDLISDLSFLHKPVEKKPTKTRTKADWLPAMVVLALLAIAIGAVAFVLTRPVPKPEEVAQVEPKKVVQPAPAQPPAVPPQPKPQLVQPAPPPTPIVPKPEPAVQPKLEPAVQPKLEPIPQLAVQPKPEPKVEPKSEPKVEPKPEPKVESTPDPTPAPKKKLAVPDEAALKKALALIRETYKEDYRASDKATLAKKLLQKADENKNDMTVRFVLLQEAKKVAADAFQGELAFEAIDAMAGEYDVSGSELKAGVLEQAAKKTRLTPDQRAAIAQAELQAMDEAIAEDNFDVAKQMSKQAIHLARLTKDRELIQDIVTKNKEVEAAAKAYADVQEAIATLKEKPDDPDANLAVGKYQCRTKGDWEKGLPMLALGSNAKLKALAERDIKGATTAEEQVKLGDAWWESNATQRAIYWYEKASPSLASLEKDRVGKRLEEITSTSLGHDIPVSGKPPLAVAPFNEKKALLHQKRWAKYLHVPVVQTNSIGMKLVLIPPGEFLMGSSDSESNADVGEKPQHRVRITSPYWLGATDVTQEEYQGVMGSNPSAFKGPTNPVEKVSWDDAVEFCQRLSALPSEKAAKRRYALPTEAQWEYACRAGNLGRRYFSAQPNPFPVEVEEKLLGEYGWFDRNVGSPTHPVAQKRANAWGLYDMYGNVWNWCQDWYDKDYYAKSAIDDPTGPNTGSYRVYRNGGRGRGNAWLCRSAYRASNVPGFRYDDVGFRVCQLTDTLVKQLTGAIVVSSGGIFDKETSEKWLDVMPRINIARDRVLGEWSLIKGKITTNGIHCARLMLPVVVEGGYDLSLEFTRSHGVGGFCILLPVRDSGCGFWVGAWDGGVSGLGQVDGKDASDNSTTRRNDTFVIGHKYTLLVKVRMQDETGSIEVLLDGKPFIEWKGKLSSLSPYRDLTLPQSKRPALSATDAITLQSVKVRAAAGKVSFVSR